MSMFDPCGSLVWCYPVKWVLVMFPVLLSSSKFFFVSSGLGLLFDEIIKKLLIEWKPSMKSFSSSVMLPMGLFMTILLLNWMSMFPFSFPVSTHFSANLAMCFPMWFGGLVYMGRKFPLETLAHLVPTGSPIILTPLLVMIEVVSTLIRPLSLSVRLLANMMAGHMVMALLSEMIIKSPFYIAPLAGVVLAVMTAFELAVCLIQAYVFSKLITLYWDENKL
uniref:ATP synthase subunit a n=1 Tax=Pedicinus obtusus TaxID=592408 RepID=A0A7L9CWG8_9NEOP|nr:ATP synthase F0 subunit 6 [Pedicinus obtusus]